MQVFLKECAVGTESEKREETVAALKEKQKQTFLLLFTKLFNFEALSINL